VHGDRRGQDKQVRAWANEKGYRKVSINVCMHVVMMVMEMKMGMTTKVDMKMPIDAMMR